jgi:uncharacterized caspase-like protein
MRAVISLVLCTLFGLAAGTAQSFAEKRVALVIGNSEYQHAPKLPNPVNDANAVSIMLEGAGFEVVELRNDLTNIDMRRALRDFSERARDADMAVVFYAGHGIEVDGTNFLIPTDAKLERDIDVEDEAISLDRLMKMVEPARKLRLVILDACRDNPFIKTMKRTMTSRSIGRGLAKVDPTMSDMLVAFAAKAGSTAADGEGNHSPFTGALLQHVASPGLDLRFAFGRIRDDVVRVTNNRQEPTLYGSLGGSNVSLVPGPAGRSEADLAAAPQPQPARPEGAVPSAWRDYELASQVATKEAWDAFLAIHTTGFYANLARAQRAKLLAAASPTDTSAKAAEPKPADTAVKDNAVKTASAPVVQPPAVERTRTLVARDREPKRAAPVAKQQRVKEKPKRVAHKARGGDGGRISRHCGSIRSAVGWATSLGLDNGVGLVSRARRFCG